MAYGLIEYGRQKKTPEALVTAAMILSKLPVADGKEDGTVESKPPAGHTKEINAALDEAAVMRAQDKLLGDLVQRTREVW